MFSSLSHHCKGNSDLRQLVAEVRQSYYDHDIRWFPASEEFRFDQRTLRGCDNLNRRTGWAARGPQAGMGPEGYEGLW